MATTSEYMTTAVLVPRLVPRQTDGGVYFKDDVLLQFQQDNVVMQYSLQRRSHRIVWMVPVSLLVIEALVNKVVSHIRILLLLLSGS